MLLVVYGDFWSELGIALEQVRIFLIDINIYIATLKDLIICLVF